MPNPSHILLDSDALFQLFIARQRDLLAKLREECGVIPAVVPEVEGEVRWHPKFKAQYEPQFIRTVASGNLLVLETPEIRKLLLARGVPEGSLDSQLRALDRRCQEYHAHVGEGEAYTHATSVTLGLPAVSNDGDALRVLLAQGKQVACPTLRFFDLLVFARAAGWIDDALGETARSHLDGAHEHLPAPFRPKDSFAANWGGFNCRLSSAPPPATHSLTSASSTLYLKIS